MKKKGVLVLALVVLMLLTLLFVNAQEQCEEILNDPCLNVLNKIAIILTDDITYPTKSLKISALAIVLKNYFSAVEQGAEGCGSQEENQQGELNLIQEKLWQQINWQKTNGPSSGGIRALALSPSNPLVIYAPVERTLYKTENGGELWKKLSVPEGWIEGRSIAIDPTNNNIIYFGNHLGIFKTTNDGDSWDEILSKEEMKKLCSNENWCVASSIAINPENSNIVYIGTVRGDIIKSTNSGQSWETVGGFSNTHTISKIIFDYTNTNIVYFATGYWDVGGTFGSDNVGYPGRGNGVFKTTDDGQTWQKINNGLPTWIHPDYSGEFITVNDLEIHPSDPQIMYSLLGNHKHSSIYKTTDGGNNWFFLKQFGGSNSMVIDPVNPNKIYVEMGYGIMQSVDGGDSWVLISGSELEHHSFFLDMHIHPEHPNTIYGASYTSAVMKSTDNGQTWFRSSDGIGNTRSYAVKAHPTDPNTAYAGAYESTLFKTIDGGQSWDAVLTTPGSGYVYSIVIDPNNPQIVYTTFGTQVFKGSTTGVYKSIDGGETWKEINKGISDSPNENNEKNIYFLAMDPQNPNILFAGSEHGDIFQTTDSGENWNRINGITTFNTVNTIITHPTKSDTILIGTNSKYADGGGIFMSADAGNSWTRSQRFSGEEEFGTTRVSPRYSYAIAFDPNNPLSVYSGDSKEAILFESKNGGNYWETVIDLREEENLKGVRSVKVDSNGNVYAGFTGKRGKIYSNKFGDWDVLNNHLTFSTIHAITIDPNDENIVYAAPWGGGFFKSINSGSSWTEIKTPTISIPAIIVDSTNSNHLIIADRMKPNIYESFDGGQSWSVLVTLDSKEYYRISTMEIHQGTLYFSVFNRITGMISLFVDGPMSGTTFKLVGGTPVKTSEGIEGNILIDLFSNDDDLYSVSHIYGINKLQGNGWVDISPEVDMGFNNIITDENNNLYLSGASDINLDLDFRIGDPNIVNEIYKSSDDGQTWVPLLKNNFFSSSIKKILRHPTNSNILFAATQTGLYVSTDGGVSWTAQNSNLNFKNIGSMIVGKTKIYIGTLGGGVYSGNINSDYSITWSQTNGPYPEIFNIQINIDPTDSNTIYATSYPGGVFKSTDGGVTWMESNFALPSFAVADPNTQGYYSLEIDPDNSNILYLGIFGKGVYKSTDGASTWMPMYGSMGQNKNIMKKGITQIKVSPVNSNEVYLATNEGVYFSDDGTKSWIEINQGLELTDVVSISISQDGKTIFAGTRGADIWKSSTELIGWSQVTKLNAEPRICWIKIDPTNSNNIYLALNPSGVYRSTNGGNTWQEKNIGLTNTVVYPIEINPKNSNEIYVGTGYGRDVNTQSGGGNGMFFSDDQGEHWKPISNGLTENIIVNTINIDPNNENYILIGTEGWNGPQEGLFLSKNKGNTWKKVNNNGIDDFSIFSVDYSTSSDVIYVGTGFSSVWKGIKE